MTETITIKVTMPKEFGKEWTNRVEEEFADCRWIAMMWDYKIQQYMLSHSNITRLELDMIKEHITKEMKQLYKRN